MKSWIVAAKTRKKAPIVDVSKYQSRVQEARLYAALLESGWSLKVNATQLDALKGIDPFFSIEIRTYTDEAVHYIEIQIDHPTPITCFGHVERPLIFPKWMFEGVDSSHEYRNIDCSFEGFPTRHRVREAWSLVDESFSINNSLKKKAVALLSSNRTFPLKSRLVNKIFESELEKHNWRFKWTDGGRQIANKVFDPSYWDVLRSSKTVYCPAGDFGWTYRFYEAVLAGAIPLINDSGSNEFLKDYATCKSIKNYLQLERLQCCISENINLAILQVTAIEVLAPENFII